MSLLEVRDLTIRYGDRTVVDGVSFDLDPGEALGLVGPSGAGKSQTGLALLGLSPREAGLSGRVSLAGVDLLAAAPEELRRQRARRIAMVFQDPALALNPYLTVGRQLGEILKAHGLAAGRDSAARVVDALGRVGLPDPERQARRYPHQLSGGMRQRVMIAAALIAEPVVLVADEPTTALDVTVQAGVLDMLDEIRGETALLLITHDLGIIAGHCERMLVLDQGRLVEAGPTAGVFREPEHVVTRALLNAAPRLGQRTRPPPDSECLLSAERLSVQYPAGRNRALAAVDDAALSLRRGETLAVVGESGAGKSSLAHAVLGLVPPASGTVVFAGNVLPALLRARSMRERRDLQLVFQDPAGSLSPSMTVAEIVAEPLAVHDRTLSADALARCVRQTLDSVGLDETVTDARPHELSGGQAQRVAIARAIVLRPAVLVCDEAVAALDGDRRQRILGVLTRLQQESGMSILFIAHDLAVVQSLAHRVAVMYLGRIVETGPTGAVFDRPRHPYTRALLDAVPLPDPANPGGRATLHGDPPSPLEPPPGCSFAPRCAWVQSRCHASRPKLETRDRSAVACIRAAELELSDRAAGLSSARR